MRKEYDQLLVELRKVKADRDLVKMENEAFQQVKWSEAKKEKRDVSWEAEKENYKWVSNGVLRGVFGQLRHPEFREAGKVYTLILGMGKTDWLKDRSSAYLGKQRLQYLL